MKAIYAESHSELTTNILGLYHDHCHHLYLGKMENLPDKYKQFKTESKYIFIYKED